MRSKKYLTPAKTLTYGFAMIITIGTFLLTLGPSSADGQKLNLIDALFTATSATCVTGLVVVDTGSQFSLFGQIILMTLTQIGGLGFMTMGTLIALAFNRRISFRDRLVLQEAMNHNSMEGILSLIRRVMIYSLVIESIGALILAARWSFEMPFSQALYFGVFHSISFFNNGGFDLFGTIHGPFGSLTRYTADPIVNMVVMVMVFLGGIGFIVISDLVNYRSTRRLSLHSKVVLSMSTFLVVFGAIVIFAMEATNPATLKSMSVGEGIFASFFHSINSRSGGLSTLSVAQMKTSTQFLIIILMFIGAAPGSTGGGIKVTVFAVLVGTMYAMVRGKEDIVFFRKRLAKESVFKAITQTWLALFLVIFVAMILSVFEDRDFLVLLFETTSAFGTVGLSLDLTPTLKEISKVILSILMFLGRLGPLTLAYALTSRAAKDPFRYPEGKITIG
ncbi:TrkH family potassium uptake protein [Paenibacillus segetis]|nr:TrkH family potassium uptake protein [Paenibacillus segetis]